ANTTKLETIGQQRLVIELGQIHAVIWLPPRVYTRWSSSLRVCRDEIWYDSENLARQIRDRPDRYFHRRHGFASIPLLKKPFQLLPGADAAIPEGVLLRLLVIPTVTTGN